MELSLRRHLPFATEANADAEAKFVETPRVHQQNILIIGAALLACMFKLGIAYNTFGTNDVAVFYMFAGSLRDHGLEWTYRNGVIFFSNFPVFNHPPATAYYLELIGNLSKNPLLKDYGVTFPFLLRFPGIIADLISVFILMRIRDSVASRQIPTWAMLLFALSPVSVMVSGFHGNTDPIVVMFLVLAAYACLVNQPLLCGVALALSCQVKVVGLLLLPILFFFWLARRAALRFTIPLVLLCVVTWAQPLFEFPMLFLKNVFSYSSYWGGWGITYWLRLTQLRQFNGTGFFNLPPAAVAVAAILKVGIIAAVLVMAWRRRYLRGPSVIDSMAYAWMILFVFAPGIAPQYMVWLAPFVLVLSPKFYGWLTVTTALALFFLYNDLTGGLPWYIGIARNSGASSTAAWMTWPWATLLIGIVLFCKHTMTVDSELRAESA